MPELDFACPKCGEDSTANVPAGGAHVACPSCGARVRLTHPDSKPTSKPVEKPAFEVVDPEPPRKKARKAEIDDEDEPRPRVTKKPRQVRLAEIDDEEDEDEPRASKGKKSKRGKLEKSGGVPIWAWAAGGVGLLAVVGVVLALTLGGKKEESQAKAAPSGQPNNAQPPAPPGPGVPIGPPRTDPPKKDPTVNPPNGVPPKGDPPKTDRPPGDIDENWPELPPRKRPAEASDAPSRTTVRWYAPPAGREPLLVLEQPRDPFPRGSAAHRGPLARELARQAVSLAAREEFGATTRDALLGEFPGDLAGYTAAGVFELKWVAIPGKNALAELSVGEGEGQREVWKAEIPLPAADLVDYARIASVLEDAARGSLAEALAKETKASRRSVGAGAASPAEVETGLKAPNYFEAFDSVRRLHAAARVPQPLSASTSRGATLTWACSPTTSAIRRARRSRLGRSSTLTARRGRTPQPVPGPWLTSRRSRDYTRRQWHRRRRPKELRGRRGPG